MTRLTAATVAAVASAASLIVAFPGAVAAPSPTSSPTVANPPLLSIAVDDGRTSVAEGEQLTYKIKIRNLGTAEAKRLRITQSLPAGLTLVSADSGGSGDAASVAWLVDLPAGQESTLTTVATVGKTPDDLLRLATVACAATDAGAKPLVCATHSDLLPAGAAATSKTDQPANRTLWYVLGAVALTLGLAALVLTRRRLRRLASRLRRSTTAANTSSV